MHVSRRDRKALKQVLGTPLRGHRRLVVQVQQQTPFPVDGRQAGSYLSASRQTILIIDVERVLLHGGRQLATRGSSRTAAGPRHSCAGRFCVGP